MPLPSPVPWWRADRHAARRPKLVARGRIKAALRGWFEREGFTEVECAALSASPGNEAHLHAFRTEAVATDGGRTPLYLHTSPEFAAKKLLAAGETRIFDFARVWRNRERGAMHHPEFTMLEWYRAHEPYEALMQDAATLLRLAADAAACERFALRGRECDPRAAPQRVTVAEAFADLAGIDLLATLADDGATDRDALAAQVRAGGVRVAEDDTWADIFSRVIAGKVEPRLGLAGRRSFANIPPRRPRSPSLRRMTRGSPSASSSMPAGWSWPTPSAN